MTLDMKITMISDTHNNHRDLGTLEGDVLIHCGDMLRLFQDDSNSLADIDEWFGEQQFDLILCIGGNHDHMLQDQANKHFRPFKNAVYLQDEIYEHQGVVFYGAPWVPELEGHAFFQPDEVLKQKWAMIPQETDVLITHTPPLGILDQSSRGMRFGCRDLLNELPRVSPKLHCFGHVHNSTGVLEQGETTYVNAASVNSQYSLVKDPLTCEI